VPDDYCYLTTTGRKTGRPHRIEIWYAYATAGDTIYLLAGGGQSSDWVQNLIANPTVLLEVDGDVRSAVGRVIDDDAEAERARGLVFDKYAPRYEGDLVTWRHRALPLAIDLHATT